ncbi:hypothetical protein Asppvi_010435 [Aspergillus pseudoviridinutans]|uniref:Stress-response A/B barrel domain-containing protein n=1 Tax=Aspergillus pseudoviridinutans TaxID=1517512 RepID=A0A9P3BPD8_9EURO|nr:uncharacterized protein Asppvi_010435 [Aspergillus pseudoviridinutans]GIJ91469.1 hypothetical protein Asppvi_010435 [Aspergillus pseudoviridinutans]
MAIIHVVQFQFKSTTSPEVIKDTCTRMLNLRENCIQPTTQKPYIKASAGGKDNSIEGLQNGITHVFVVEFENEADREYYVRTDPAHQAFVKSLDGVIEKAQVVDFTPGVF